MAAVGGHPSPPAEAASDGHQEVAGRHRLGPLPRSWAEFPAQDYEAQHAVKTLRKRDLQGTTEGQFEDVAEYEEDGDIEPESKSEDEPTIALAGEEAGDVEGGLVALEESEDGDRGDDQWEEDDEEEPGPGPNEKDSDMPVEKPAEMESSGSSKKSAKERKRRKRELKDAAQIWRIVRMIKRL